MISQTYRRYAPSLLYAVLASLIIGCAITALVTFGPDSGPWIGVLLGAVFVTVLTRLDVEKVLLTLIVVVPFEGLASLAFDQQVWPLLLKDFILIVLYLKCLVAVRDIHVRGFDQNRPLVLSACALTLWAVLSIANPALPNLAQAAVGLRTLLLYIPL